MLTLLILNRADEPGPALAELRAVVDEAEPRATHLRPFIHVLQAIVAGSRDRALADVPELDYTMAAAILLLIETLEGRR